MNIQSRLAKFNFTRNRSEFYDDLYRSLEDLGNPRDFILARYERAKATKDVGLATLYQNMMSLLGRYPLGTALSVAVPKDDVMLLTAAESSGDVVSSLKFLVKKIANEKEMRVAMIAAIAMPFILFSLLIGLYAWVGISFLPILDSMFPHDKWQGMSAVFFVISNFCKNYGVLLYLVFFAIFFWWLWSLANWSNRMIALRRFLDKFPPYRSYRQIQAASFLVILSSLLESNVSLRDAIQNIQVNSSAYLSYRLQLILHALVRFPDNPGLAFEVSGLFDTKTSTRLIEYGKRTNFAQATKKIGDGIMETTLQSVKRDAKLVSAFGLAIVGLAVAFAFLNIIMLPNEATSYMKSRY